jgi:hypothetical protein
VFARCSDDIPHNRALLCTLAAYGESLWSTLSLLPYFVCTVVSHTHSNGHHRHDPFQMSQLAAAASVFHAIEKLQRTTNSANEKETSEKQAERS